MKRMLLFCLCASLLLTGCGKDIAEESDIPIQESSIETQPMVPELPEIADVDVTETIELGELLAVSVPAATECFEAEDGTVLFTHTSQHMQLIFPNTEVADKVIIDFLNRVDASRADVESILQTAKDDYQATKNWIPYFYQTLYSPTRIDYGVLSLFGVQSSFTGGVHGSKSCIAANYDMMTGDALTLGSIMHADATVEDYIKIIVNHLTIIADECHLYPGYEDGVRSRLNGDENLYEDFYFTKTGLCFFFAPYEIAPYSSGIITVEIPYQELAGLIYDGYFPAEEEKFEGQVHTGFFEALNMEEFNNMAEVILTTGEETMVAYPYGKVEDVKIVIPGNGKDIPDYTVFAAYEMSGRDAVVISLSEEMIEGIYITYFSGDQMESVPLHE